jgi:type VI secretion system protein ImpC
MAKEKAEPQGAKEARAVELEGSALLDKIIESGRWKGDAGRAMARDIIGEFAKQVLEGEITVAKDTEAMINARIAQIDALISRQLNEIMHAEEFQRLEASWRGLHYLVNKTETSPLLQIKVLNVTKKELSRDLEKAVEFDQSALFKKVYEEEYGMFGGAPFGALIGDYEFGKHPQDISLLEKISNVAAAAHAPFISAASPELLNLESFTQLDDPRDLAKIFETTEYAKWRSFRESEDSRYVGLCLPHILMRLPYGESTQPVEAFRFEEEVDGKDHRKYLWGNAAYAFATRLTESFAKYNWCASIRGVEGGGLVEGLPVHNFKTDDGDIALEVPDGDRHQRTGGRRSSPIWASSPGALQGHGLRGILRRTVLQEGQEVYDSESANANARLSTQMQYIHGGLAFRALPEGHDARQDRQLHVAQERRGFSQPVDRALHPAGRRRLAGSQGAAASAGSPHRRQRDPGQTRLLPSRGFPQAALPAG